jgi:hypothetical protein
MAAQDPREEAIATAVPADDQVSAQRFRDTLDDYLRDAKIGSPVPQQVGIGWLWDDGSAECVYFVPSRGEIGRGVPAWVNTYLLTGLKGGEGIEGP